MIYRYVFSEGGARLLSPFTLEVPLPLAHLGVRVPSIANPNYAGDDVMVCKRCGIHSSDFATVACRELTP